MTTPSALNAATGYQTGISNASGYLTPSQLLGTSQGQNWLNELYNTYYGNMQAGVDNFGMPGNEYLGANGEVTQFADPNLRSIMTMTLQNPQYNPALFDWMMGQGGMPQVPTMTRDIYDAADKRARDLADINNQAAMDQIEAQGRIEAKLQQGLITSNEAIAEANRASQERMLKAELAYKYEELTWTKKYGKENLQILRDRLSMDYERLGLDKEVAKWQQEHDARRVAVQEGYLGLDKEKFGLEKNIQEAMLRANPYNAVANALYTRGQQSPGGVDEFGQPLTTLDNSGTLPFLQTLQAGDTIRPLSGGGGMYMNQGGIGGNTAPNPNQISQRSAQNMSEAEKGITTSLAQYGGWDPNDYWKASQKSWNTSGQKKLNFGGTRLG